jgi:Fic family protein
LIDRLFANPYITAKMVSQHLSCSTPAAQRALDSLVQLGILEETGERVDRSRLYVAREILSVLIK